MARKPKKGVPSRVPLSRERVLRAAIALADESGIESVSMRRLGRELGVEAMSLYRHVANRDEVLNGIIEMVISEVEVPAQGAEWKQAMRRRALSAREMLLRHSWASALSESLSSFGPARLRYADAIIGCMREAGFPIASAYNAFLTLDSYVFGFSLQEVSWPSGCAQTPQEAAVSFQAQFPPEAYPHLAEMTEFYGSRNGAPDYSTQFEFGLNLILDGLEKLRGPSPD